MGILCGRTAKHNKKKARHHDEPFQPKKIITTNYTMKNY